MTHRADLARAMTCSAEHDADELRAQVRRLEALVAHLTSQREALSDQSSSPGTSAFGDRSPVQEAPSPTFVQFPSAGRPSLKPSTSSESATNKVKMDLRASDLCEGLSQLVIKEFCVVEGSGEESWAPGGQRGTPFIDEAESFLASMPQQFGLTANMPAFAPKGFGGAPSAMQAGARHGSTGGRSAAQEGLTAPSPMPSEVSAGSSELSPSPLGSQSFHRSAPPLADALKFLPTSKEALSAYTYYSGYVSW